MNKEKILDEKIQSALKNENFKFLDSPVIQEYMYLEEIKHSINNADFIKLMEYLSKKTNKNISYLKKRFKYLFPQILDYQILNKEYTLNLKKLKQRSRIENLIEKYRQKDIQYLLDNYIEVSNEDNEYLRTVIIHEKV